MTKARILKRLEFIETKLRDTRAMDGIWLVQSTGWINGDIPQSELSPMFALLCFARWIERTSFQNGYTYYLSWVYGSAGHCEWEMREGQPFMSQDEKNSGMFIAMPEIEKLKDMMQSRTAPQQWQHEIIQGIEQGKLTVQQVADELETEDGDFMLELLLILFAVQDVITAN